MAALDATASSWSLRRLLSARVPFCCLIHAKTQSLSSTSMPGGGGRVVLLGLTRDLGVVAFLVRGVSGVGVVLEVTGVSLVVVLDVVVVDVEVVVGLLVVEVGGGVGLILMGVVGRGAGASYTGLRIVVEGIGFMGIMIGLSDRLTFGLTAGGGGAGAGGGFEGRRVV